MKIEIPDFLIEMSWQLNMHKHPVVAHPIYQVRHGKTVFGTHITTVLSTHITYDDAREHWRKVYKNDTSAHIFTLSVESSREMVQLIDWIKSLTNKGGE